MDSMHENDLERIVVPGIDGALLMELLEGSCIDDADDDNCAAVDDWLSYVIRSLEAEIRGDGTVAISDGESTTGLNDETDDGGLEEMLSDLDARGGGISLTYVAEEPFDWSEMEVVTDMVSSDMGGWYMDAEDGEVGYGGEAREYYYGNAYYGEASMEQVFSPLWE